MTSAGLISTKFILNFSTVMFLWVNSRLLIIDLYNLRQNIRRLFHVLARFLFTGSETELDFITRKCVLALPHELPNAFRLRFLGISKTLGFDGKCLADRQKPTFNDFGKISQKISSKTFQIKYIFLSFVNLSRTFYRRLQFSIVFILIIWLYDLFWLSWSYAFIQGSRKTLYSIKI